MTIFHYFIAKPSDADGKLKWEAWNGKKGIDSKTAKELYITKYNVLASKYA